MSLKTKEHAPLLCIIVIFMLALSGCQSLPHSTAGKRNSAQIPGQVARAKYEHVSAAIAELNRALGGEEVNLANVPMDSSLFLELPLSELQTSESAVDALRRIASTEIITSSNYFLVYVDTLSGRIEYRSTKDRSHLSVTVRAPQQGEKAPYLVSNIFSQASLKELVGSLPNRSSLQYTASNTTGKNNGFMKVGFKRGKTDADTLAYYNSLPEIERNRADLLSLRALLLMRLNQDEKAVPLVKQGIIRYPRSSMFLSLADVLFERKNGVATGKSDSISHAMQLRFNRQTYAENRKNINAFLNEK